MKVSTKGRYAVRIMAELAQHPDEYISVAELATRQDISAKYIEKILALLLKAKLIDSTRGAQGGYKLNIETPPALRGGRAAAVALVAKQMAEAGQAVLPEALLPDYHRLSQAERERAERLAAEAAAHKEQA